MHGVGQHIELKVAQVRIAAGEHRDLLLGSTDLRDAVNQSVPNTFVTLSQAHESEAARAPKCWQKSDQQFASARPMYRRGYPLTRRLVSYVQFLKNVSRFPVSRTP